MYVMNQERVLPVATNSTSYSIYTCTEVECNHRCRHSIINFTCTHSLATSLMIFLVLLPIVAVVCIGTAILICCIVWVKQSESVWTKSELEEKRLANGQQERRQREDSKQDGSKSKAKLTQRSGNRHPGASRDSNQVDNIVDDVNTQRTSSCTHIEMSDNEAYTNEHQNICIHDYEIIDDDSALFRGANSQAAQPLTTTNAAYQATGISGPKHTDESSTYIYTYTRTCTRPMQGNSEMETNDNKAYLYQTHLPEVHVHVHGSSTQMSLV